jgi:membrane-associated phospholipid phosphatase
MSAPADAPLGPDIDREEGPVLARRLALAAVLAVMGAALSYVLLVRTSLGQRFDEAAFEGGREQVPGLAATAGSQLRRITADSFAVVLVALVAIGVLRRRVVLGLGAAFAAGIAVVVTDLLKNHVLTRPVLIPAGSAVNTFPSGHTTAAVACAMALILVTPARWRGVSAVVAGAYGWVTAAQVQTAGWHRPSDAIGAAFLAFASVTGVGALLAWTRPTGRPAPGRHFIAQGILGAVGVANAAVIIWGLLEVLRYLGGHARGLPVPPGMRHDAYVTGLSVTVEVVIILLMVLLGLLGRANIDAGERSPAFWAAP